MVREPPGVLALIEAAAMAAGVGIDCSQVRLHQRVGTGEILRRLMKTIQHCFLQAPCMEEYPLDERLDRVAHAMECQEKRQRDNSIQQFASFTVLKANEVINQPFQDTE